MPRRRSRLWWKALRQEARLHPHRGSGGDVAWRYSSLGIALSLLNFTTADVTRITERVHYARTSGSKGKLMLALRSCLTGG